MISPIKQGGINHMKTMKTKNILILILTAFILPAMPTVLLAQGQTQDYQRAAGLRERLQPLALNMVETSSWIGKTHRFWYKKSTEEGSAFFMVDADAQTKKKAFDHEKLAAGLAEVLGEKVKPYDLPFRLIEFSEDEKSIEFTVGPFEYSCNLETYACIKVGPASRWRRGGFDMWKRGPSPQAASPDTNVSPDGQWEAFIKNFNVAVRSKESGEEFFLSRDGSEGNYYTFSSLTWSRVDLPPRTELRRTADRQLVMEVENTDISRLVEVGWKPPEVFTAKGRDSRTDIWGIIIRPMDFDPEKKYPVVEYIYAGPHSSHVPKTFSPCFRMQPLAEMGFIVVQIDGMGTSNRSKAFHDVEEVLYLLWAGFVLNQPSVFQPFF